MSDGDLVNVDAAAAAMESTESHEGDAVSHQSRKQQNQEEPPEGTPQRHRLSDPRAEVGEVEPEPLPVIRQRPAAEALPDATQLRRYLRLQTAAAGKVEERGLVEPGPAAAVEITATQDFRQTSLAEGIHRRRPYRRPPLILAEHSEDCEMLQLDYEGRERKEDLFAPASVPNFTCSVLPSMS